MFHIKYKLTQFLLDVFLIMTFAILNKISLTIAYIAHNVILIQSNAEIIGYEKILAISKILTSTVLFATAIYRFWDLIKEKEKRKTSEEISNTNHKPVSDGSGNKEKQDETISSNK